MQPAPDRNGVVAAHISNRPELVSVCREKEDPALADGYAVRSRSAVASPILIGVAKETESDVLIGPLTPENVFYLDIDSRFVEQQLRGFASGDAGATNRDGPHRPNDDCGRPGTT